MADLRKLLVYFRHNFFELINLLRGTNACYYVLALCIHQELAHQMLFTGCRIAGKCNAGTGGLAHISECHHLHVDCCTPGIRDIVVAAVNVCTRVVPGTEYSLDCLHQLFLRIYRKVLADFCFVLCLELICQLFEIVCSQLNVLCHTFFCFHLVDELFEIFFAYFHNDIREHLDKSAVAVPCPSRIAGFCRKYLYYFLIQTQVQDCVHHARHGCSCSGTNGNKKRVLFIAKLFAGNLFHLLDRCHNLCHDLVVDLSAVLIILCAGLCRDCKALRYRKAKVCHLRKIGTFSAKKISHIGISFCKHINPFCRHVTHSS